MCLCECVIEKFIFKCVAGDLRCFMLWSLDNKGQTDHTKDVLVSWALSPQFFPYLNSTNKTASILWGTTFVKKRYIVVGTEYKDLSKKVHVSFSLL